MTIENEKTVDIKGKAISYGIILGVLSFILGIITQVIAKNATGLLTLTLSSFLITYGGFIALSCYLSILLRRAIGGYWDFSTALKNIFIMLAVAGILSTIGTSVMNVVYPRLQEEAINNVLNVTIESLEGYGAPDEQIDATVEEIEKQKEALGSLSIGQVVKGLAISLILYFVFALILAAIFKKERPVFTEPRGDEAHPWQDNNGPNPNLP